MGKNKKTTTGYSNVKNITKYIEKHPQRVAAIGSAISAIMTGLFKVGTYFYYRGYFDQLNIPSTYIMMNYWDMLYLFLLNLAVLFIVFVFSNIYITYTMELYTKRKVIGCILLQVAMILVGMLLVLGYMLIQLSSDYSCQEIRIYVKEEPGHLLFYMISLSILFYCIIWVAGTPAHTFFGVTNSESVSTEQKKELEDKDANQSKKRVLRHPFLCFVIFMVFAVIISGVSVYSSGKDKVTLMRKINIVAIDEKTYFVAEENKEWCILKECIQDGDDVAINNNHYMVSSLINRDVYVIELDTGVKSHLIDAKEYSQIQLK